MAGKETTADNAPAVTKAERQRAQLDEAVAEGIPLDVFKRRWIIVAAMCTSLLAVMLANSSMNLALPGMTSDLGITQSEQTWIVDLFSLVFAALLFTAGAVGDRYGRKLVLQIGMVLFTVPSLYAGIMASTGVELIVARGVMGIGAAMVMPSTLSIINTTFPRGQRAGAIAVWTGVAGAGAGLGTVVSGVLLEFWSWRSAFLMSVVFGVIAFVANQILCHESKDEKRTPIDWPGGALSTVGILGLVYAIIEGPHHGWTEPGVVVAIVAAVVGIGLFIWWERKTPHPMLDLTLFNNPLFSVSSTSCLIAFFALGGAFYLLAQLFQLVLGYGTLKSALLTLPIMVPMLLLSPLVPRVSAAIGSKLTIGAGLVVIAGGFLLCSTWTGDTGYWGIVLPLFVVVIGMVFVMPPATNLIIAAVPKNRSGMGSAMNDTVRELGVSLGIAVLGTLIARGYDSGIGEATTSLPAAAAEAAESSFPAALQGVAPMIEQTAGPAAAGAFVDTATSAWMTGLSWAMIAAAILSAVAAAWTFTAMPNKRREAGFVLAEPARESASV
ncbi:MFS transporter [Prauserella oleivorans]|uniref:MFS transporter n=1 Tax=Prauserella oleivorans TaxID=1478153 RepID=A0ABW5WIL8_9PSEU